MKRRFKKKLNIFFYILERQYNPHSYFTNYMIIISRPTISKHELDFY